MVNICRLREVEWKEEKCWLVFSSIIRKKEVVSGW